MRKRSKYRPRAQAAPYLAVARTIPELEISERISVQAFRDGWAAGDHYDVLAYCRNMLMLAGQEQKDEGALRVVTLAGVALVTIEQRHKETGQFTATSSEADALLLLVNFAEDWWRRKSGTLYIRISKVLGAIYKTDSKEALVA